MFNLTDSETPILSFGSEFTDPVMFAAMEAEQDALDAPFCSLLGRTGYIDGRWVGFRSNGSPVGLD